MIGYLSRAPLLPAFVIRRDDNHLVCLLGDPIVVNPRQIPDASVRVASRPLPLSSSDRLRRTRTSGTSSTQGTDGKSRFLGRAPTSARVTLPMATRMPSASTSPSIFDHPSDSAGHAGARLEHLIRSRTPGNLKVPSAATRRSGRRRSGGRRGRRQSASLGEQFHEDDCWHDGVTGKVSLKVPVVRVRDPQPPRRLSRDELGNLLDQSHGRPMGKQVDALGY